MSIFDEDNGERPHGAAFLEFCLVTLLGLVVHAAHATAARGHAHWGFLLRVLGDHCFGGDEEAGDRGRVLQCRAHDLGRVDDASRDEILVSSSWASRR